MVCWFLTATSSRLSGNTQELVPLLLPLCCPQMWKVQNISLSRKIKCSIFLGGAKSNMQGHEHDCNQWLLKIKSWVMVVSKQKKSKSVWRLPENLTKGVTSCASVGDKDRLSASSIPLFDTMTQKLQRSLVPRRSDKHRSDGHTAASPQTGSYGIRTWTSGHISSPSVEETEQDTHSWPAVTMETRPGRRGNS